MRQKLSKIFGKELRFLAIKTREHLGITQRQMGELLRMGESSYSDIETGKYNCSMPTAILLLNMQPEPTALIQGCVAELIKSEEREMQGL